MEVRTMTSEGSVSDAFDVPSDGKLLTAVLLWVVPEILDLLADVTLWHLNIILHLTIISHQGKESIVGDVKLLALLASTSRSAVLIAVAAYKLILLAGDDWDIHVVGGWAKLLKLLAGEDINGDQVNLGVSVLAGLGGRHVDNLTWAALDADESVLSQGGTLHWVGGRRAGIGRVEGVLMLEGESVMLIMFVMS